MSRKEDVEKYFKLQFGLDTTDEKRKDAKNLQIEMLSDLRYIYRYRGVGEIERVPVGQPIEMRLPEFKTHHEVTSSISWENGAR